MVKDKRNYNVFFNLHTVSGIVITVGLFVCFFAGAIAMFYHNINNWESNVLTNTNKYNPRDIDYEKALNVIEQEGYKMNGRDFYFSIENHDNKEYLTVRSKSKNKPSKKENKAKQPVTEQKFSPDGTIGFYIDLKTYKKVEGIKPEKRSGEEAHGDPEALGTAIYHLHYFDQIPKVGEYLSGLVSLFFMVAIVSGIIIHWKKIVSNFFTFRIKNSLKNLWTDAHTSLGIIGLPFQLMYAVTGTLMGLLMIYVMSTVNITLDGDRKEFIGMIIPSSKVFPATGIINTERVNLNELAHQSISDLGIDDNDFEIKSRIINYNDETAKLALDYSYVKGKSFYQRADILYQLKDGEIISKNKIDDQSYRLGVVISTIQTLHFGNYGGNLLKIIYFVLSLITCFVILTGVLIWLEARNNKMYKNKHKFNTNVGAVFFGICMGLYPAIAFFFCLTKIFPSDIEHRFRIIENGFFISWLLYVLYAFWLKNIHLISKNAILLGGILGVIIPFLNGFHSGLWFWKSLSMGYTDSFYVDVTWLVSGVISIIVALKMKPIAKKNKK